MKQKLLQRVFIVAFLFFTNLIFSQAVSTNEFHYDNVSTGTGEAIEIAGPAGTEIISWSIVLYNGVRIFEQKVSLEEGQTFFPLNLGRAIPGIYLVKIQGAGFESEPLKIIKY